MKLKELLDHFAEDEGIMIKEANKNGDDFKLIYNGAVKNIDINVDDYQLTSTNHKNIRKLYDCIAIYVNKKRVGEKIMIKKESFLEMKEEDFNRFSSHKCEIENCQNSAVAKTKEQLPMISLSGLEFSEFFVCEYHYQMLKKKKGKFNE